MRSIAITLLLSLASGCSTVKSWIPGVLEGEDNAAPPTALTPVESPVKFTRRWSRDIGVGFDEYNLSLRPAVSDGRVYAADREGTSWRSTPCRVTSSGP